MQWIVSFNIYINAFFFLFFFLLVVFFLEYVILYVLCILVPPWARTECKKSLMLAQHDHRIKNLPFFLGGGGGHLCHVS